MRPTLVASLYHSPSAIARKARLDNTAVVGARRVRGLFVLSPSPVLVRPWNSLRNFGFRGYEARVISMKWT